MKIAQLGKTEVFLLAQLAYLNLVTVILLLLVAAIVGGTL